MSYVKNSLPSSIFSTSASPSLPNATPRFYPSTSKNSIILGIRRWSPMLSELVAQLVRVIRQLSQLIRGSLGRRLASMIISVEEQYADELTDQIIRDSITETMATLRDVGDFSHLWKFEKRRNKSCVKFWPKRFFWSLIFHFSPKLSMAIFRFRFTDSTTCSKEASLKSSSSRLGCS